MQLHPTKITVTRTVKKPDPDGGKAKVEVSEMAQEVIEVKKFATKPLVIKFGLEAKNCAKFQTAGVFVGIEYPCYVEEVEEGFEAAKALVRQRLVGEIPVIEGVVRSLIDQKIKIEKDY